MKGAEEDREKIEELCECRAKWKGAPGLLDPFRQSGYHAWFLGTLSLNLEHHVAAFTDDLASHLLCHQGCCETSKKLLC